MTIYGGIANFTSDIIFHTDEQTNSDGWIEFVRKIKAYHDEHYIEGPIVLVLDNHRVHLAKAVRKAYQGFKLLFLPPYASYMSGVERLWAIYKREFGKHVDRTSHEMSQL